MQLASDDQGELPDVEATITWVAPELNLEIRAREVHMHLQTTKQRLLPGSLVNARIRDGTRRPTRGRGSRRNRKRGAGSRSCRKRRCFRPACGTSRGAWRAGNPTDGCDSNSRRSRSGRGIEDESGNDLYVVRAGLKPGDEVATQGVFLIDSQAQLAGTPSLLFPTGAVAPQRTRMQHCTGLSFEF